MNLLAEEASPAKTWNPLHQGPVLATRSEFSASPSPACHRPGSNHTVPLRLSNMAATLGLPGSTARGLGTQPDAPLGGALRRWGVEEELPPPLAPVDAGGVLI